MGHTSEDALRRQCPPSRQGPRSGLHQSRGQARLASRELAAGVCWRGSPLTWAMQPALRCSVHATPSPLTAQPHAATLRAPSADGVHLTYGSSGVWRPEGRDMR